MAAKKWVYGTWHEADIGSPGSAVASMTGIEVAACQASARLRVNQRATGRFEAWIMVWGPASVDA